ncbi:OLC1v1001559C1 [Oldenlandia corymbosa var. corymbosa]|uniref:OLC1v1001559C1 n=1 Tax=Oldenlandia corymbosa var. corymbosa TaxID=529605 RepID=A0AAV1D692_OLDCO|nr:OLC1v1001559C1 [Oldenlandia corymbosa var. corymbosa]
MARTFLFKQVGGDLSFLNSSPFAKLLDSCISSKSAGDVGRVHARILKTQFRHEVFINNRLIDAYGKCGVLDSARKVFDRMPDRNIFTWNSIIDQLMVSGGLVDEAEKHFHLISEPDQCSWNLMVSGFARHEFFSESLEYFVKMHSEDFKFNDYSYGSALRACAGLRDFKMGTQIHASVSKSFYASDVFIESALIDMYSKCGRVSCAQKVFDGMKQRNVVSWNSLITCYEQNGPANEGLIVFRNMMNCGIEPDEMTLASVVSACASLNAVKEGKEIHARVIKFDRFRNDVIICNALVDMYAKCGRILEARCIFDRMQTRTVVSETCMVSGYAKVASVESAKALFGRMIERNVVSWNALIAGYTQNGENEEALGLFLQLKRASVWPTHYTFGNLLNACANLADLKLGRQSHAHVLKHGFRFQHGPETDIFVGNSLIDMYMKCGSVVEAKIVFKNMVQRDYVSWNAMIVGYAQNGQGTEAIEFFRQMLKAGEKPDHVTMIGVLSACTHAGLVEEGRHYFNSMKEYGIEPLKDHFTCMVDLLGKAARLNEAMDLIKTMPMPPDGVVWGSLLAACRVHGNIDMGIFVAEKLLELDPNNSGSYVLLSNMYAQREQWTDVKRIRKRMRQQGVVKQPGCSWIEIRSMVHVFMAKDKRHPQKNEIYSLLKNLTELMRLSGYVPDIGALVAHEEQQNSEYSKMLSREWSV